ncbi:unnamed protein product [Staurois parvus]|uniref:Uncharacterized protein n=1 Tax=Staurois parvus TaxID=386267 RepID=A0ABN9H2W2_9NEOB|nr:unnamed protein product [Staurois parvus]
MLNLVFFFPWESACDQHRANQHCPEVRGPASSYSRKRAPPISFNQCSARH